MRLKKIEVRKLFGVFDHEIPLHLDEKITIIHGPNGYGKTAILRMVQGLLTGNLQVLSKVPFESFTLSFDDGSSVVATKSSERSDEAEFSERQSPPRSALESMLVSRRLRTRREKSRDVSLPAVELTHFSPDGKSEPVLYRQRGIAAKDRSPELLRAIDAFVPVPLSLVNGYRWLNRETGEFWSLEKILEVYGDEITAGLSNNPELRSLLFGLTAPNFSSILNSISVHFIETQRLGSEIHQSDEWDGTGQQTVLSVQRHSEEIAAQIQRVLAKYAAESQQLDRSFPRRLLDQDRGQPEHLSKEQLREKFQEIETKRKKLIEIGVLDQEPSLSLPPDELLERRADVLTIYVQDVEKKLGVFDDLATRVSVLMQIINDRFKFKSMSISRETGFEFTSKLGRLSPRELSSGEQHELVLLYQLLFSTEPSSLILIDEPEISLHVGWQQEFLNDLQRIVGLSKADILIATHSPVVIGEHWDLTIELQSPVDDKGA